VTTLNASQKHLLRLAKNGAGEDGWTPVSNLIWPLLAQVPDRLLDREWPEGAEKGRCRLTADGEAIVEFMG
jgi:hypothetical protein